MSRTVVHLVIGFTFVSNGSYTIPLEGGRKVNITIAHATSGLASTGILGMTSHGNVQVLPDDPNGFMNVSNVTVELPFLVESSEPGLTMSMLDSHFDSRPDIIEIKEHSLMCLNRLIDVVRYNTRRYWMRTLRPQDLFIYKIMRDNEGKTEEELAFSPPSTHDFPIQVLDENAVKSKILEMLGKGTRLPLSLMLWFDSLNLYSSGRFNEAVITANVSFEVLTDEYLSSKYKSEGKNEQEIEQLVGKDFKDGLHKLIRKKFFAGLDHDALIKKPETMYVKFDNFRNKRTSAIHHRLRNISKEEALVVIQDSREVGLWILGKK